VSVRSRWHVDCAWLDLLCLLGIKGVHRHIKGFAPRCALHNQVAAPVGVNMRVLQPACVRVCRRCIVCQSSWYLHLEARPCTGLQSCSMH
jgi:hypothetical protein